MQAILRRSLLTRLDTDGDTFLTLVRSPAGYGKTTLLIQYWQRLAAAGERVAWLSLDEDDSDPDLFMAYVSNALSSVGLATGHSPGTVPTGRDLPETANLPSLLNALETDGPPIFLILDDYHLAEGGKLDRLMERLLRRPLNRLRIVLSTRTRPGFPASRLRANGSLREITERELRFDREDIAALFGPVFAPTDLEVLADRTEGWPVALQLARVWIERNGDNQSLISAFSGSAMEMAGYLADQVVNGLPESYRSVLLATSILDAVSGDLADYLTGSNDGAAVLLDLARINVPIFALDEQHDTYRYHPIFRDFLQAQLNLSGRSAVCSLHRKASLWFAGGDDVATAVCHAVAAGDNARAFELAEDVSWVRHIMSSRIADLRRVMAVLPFDEVLRRPRLALAQAYLDCKNGDIQGGARILAHARSLVREQHDAGDPAWRRRKHGIQQDLLLLKALCASYFDHGMSPDSVRSIEQLLNEAEATDYGFRGLVNNVLGVLYFRSGSLLGARAALFASIADYERVGLIQPSAFMHIHLLMVALTQGRLHEAQSWCDKARQFTREHFSSDNALSHPVKVFEAEIHYQCNRIEAASELLFEALPDAAHSESWVELHLSAYRTAASIAFHERGLAAAEEVLTEGHKIADRSGFARLALNLDCHHVTFLNLAGDFEQAERLACGRNLVAVAAGNHGSAVSWREREEAAVCLARLALGTGDTEAADGLLAPLEERCLKGDFGRRLIQCRLLRAMARKAAGDMDSAVHYLKQALADAREEGFVRLFIDEGDAARDLLKAAVVQMGVASIPDAMYDWISELLVAFDAGADPQKSGLGALVLTARELEILQSLYFGGSNKEIARRLGMTDNAVKFHMKNIFRKLGVNTRQLAVVVAKKRELIAVESLDSEAV